MRNLFVTLSLLLAVSAFAQFGSGQGSFGTVGPGGGGGPTNGITAAQADAKNLAFVATNAVYSATKSSVTNTSPNSAIVGGISNSVNDLNDDDSTMAYSVIIGGNGNNISDSQGCVILGGLLNNFTGGEAYSLIGGGQYNTMGQDVNGCAIVAGSANTIPIGNGDNDNSFIGAGLHNSNTGDAAFIGAGQLNSIGNEAANAMIVGGISNTISDIGTNSFAGGAGAKANYHGSFVWSDDSHSGGEQDTAPNQYRVKATGGVYFDGGTVNGNGAGLTVNATNIIGAPNYYNFVTNTPPDGGFVGADITGTNLFRTFNGRGMTNLVTVPSSGQTNVVGEDANGTLFPIPLANLPSGGGGGGGTAGAFSVIGTGTYSLTQTPADVGAAMHIVLTNAGVYQLTAQVMFSPSTSADDYNAQLYNITTSTGLGVQAYFSTQVTAGSWFFSLPLTAVVTTTTANNVITIYAANNGHATGTFRTDFSTITATGPY